MLLVVDVSLAVATLVSVSAFIVLQRVRRKLQERSDFSNNTQSLRKSTTSCLNTRADVVRFVASLQNQASDLQWIMITRLDSFGVFYVSCATREYSEPVQRTYFSRQLLTSLTLQELQFLENELRLVARNVEEREGGKWWESPPPEEDDDDS